MIRVPLRFIKRVIESLDQQSEWHFVTDGGNNLTVLAKSYTLFNGEPAVALEFEYEEWD